MIKPGQEWGSRADEPPDLDVEGDDRALARAVAHAAAGTLVRFVPSGSSDLARAVGLDTNGPTEGIALPLDVLALGDGRRACNMVVVGVAPDRLRPWSRPRAVTVTVDGRRVFEGRATGVVIATGEFLRGCDLIPRGHPGDGRAEVQVYALRPGERAALRGRLANGTHVPHPRIIERAGARIEVAAARPAPLELDGAATPRQAECTVNVVAGAYRLLV